MTKYYGTVKKRTPPRPDGPNPIWRGFGCVMNIIILIMSYAAAYMLVDTAVTQKWPGIPYQLMGYPAIHPLLWKVTALVPLWSFISKQENLYAILVVAILFIIIMEAIMSAFYAFVFRASVPRYGPLDVPPPNVKIKRYKR